MSILRSRARGKDDPMLNSIENYVGQFIKKKVFEKDQKDKDTSKE